MMCEVIAQYGSTEQTTFQHTGLVADRGTMCELDILDRLSALSAASGTLLQLEFHTLETTDDGQVQICYSGGMF